MRFIVATQLILSLYLTGCAGGSSGGSSNQSNEGGSSPINPQEERDYKRAVNKCFKTGGSRVVKVEGRLQCY